METTVGGVNPIALVRFIVKKYFPEQDREEFEGEGLVELSRMLPKYDPQRPTKDGRPMKLAHYLFIGVLQRLRWKRKALIRDQRRLSTTTIRNTEPEYEQRYWGLEQDDVQQLLTLMALSEQQRLVLRRLYWEDKSLRQIGDELSMSHEQVRQINNRTLHLLRQRLSED